MTLQVRLLTATQTLLVVCISIVLMQPYCRGDLVSILDVNPSQANGFNEAHGDGMVGWLFTIPQSVTITGVGWYDHGGDGLSRPYQVGLWQDLQGSGPFQGSFATGSNPTQLLGTPANGLTIPGGTEALLVDGIWRAVSFPTPLVLPPGTYELAGLDTATTTDVIKFVLATGGPLPARIPGQFGSTFFWAPNFDSDATGFRPVTSNGFYLAPGYEFGPMLFTSIPEPSSLLLVGVGAIVLSLRRGRKKICTLDYQAEPANYGLRECDHASNCSLRLSPCQ